MIEQADIDRFWALVDRGEPDECWEWRSGKGWYGAFSFRGKQILSHRFAVWLTTGSKPDDYVLHHCDNPPCVNPAHLFIGTAHDNMQDALKKNRIRTGTRAPQASLNDAQVQIAHSLYKEGKSCKEIAAHLDVHKGSVARLIRGKTYRDADAKPVKLPRRDRPHPKARCSSCKTIVSISASTGRLRVHGFQKQGAIFQTSQRCRGEAETI